MLNIVVPMAGNGARFQAKGYSLPKPLIPVNGKPMIEIVVENLTPTVDCRFTFLVLKQHLEQFDLEEKLSHWAPDSKIVCIEKVTEGAAATVLLAEKLIDNQDPLIIANSDQLASFSVDTFIQKSSAFDGLILTMHASTPEWSYVKLNSENDVIEVAEKRVISNHATVGIYFFGRGKDFVDAAQQMIAANDRVNGEFYVAPTFNYMIQQGKKIGVFPAGLLGREVHSFGTPEHLEIYLSSNKGIVP